MGSRTVSGLHTAGELIHLGPHRLDAALQNIWPIAASKSWRLAGRAHQASTLVVIDGTLVVIGGTLVVIAETLVVICGTLWSLVESSWLNSAKYRKHFASFRCLTPFL